MGETIKITTATDREACALRRLRSLERSPHDWLARLAAAKANELEQAILARDEGEQDETYEVDKEWLRPGRGADLKNVTR